MSHFYILALPGGGGGGGGGGVTLTKKKNHFFRGFEEKVAITRLILRLAPYNHLHSIENQILVKIKLKRDTRLQK